MCACIYVHEGCAFVHVLCVCVCVPLCVGGREGACVCMCACMHSLTNVSIRQDFVLNTNTSLIIISLLNHHPFICSPRTMGMGSVAPPVQNQPAVQLPEGWARPLPWQYCPGVHITQAELLS